MPEITPDTLNSPIAFAPIPFRRDRFDPEAHIKNVKYLIDNNFLDGGRKRVIALGGSSLIHHLSAGEQLDLAQVTAEAVGDRALWISAVLPTPVSDAMQVVLGQMRLKRPPDAFLVMPVAGVCNPEGLSDELQRLTTSLARESRARFLLYLRDSGVAPAYSRLARDCDHVLGVKIGTSVSDVAPVRTAVGHGKAVVWGIGDLSTDGIQAGARGHTSGTAIVCARLVDELNNAQRRGDLEGARQLEDAVRSFEEIRFMANRSWNYSAVIELMKIAAFDDVDPGDGGPFNAPPPAEITTKLKDIAGELRAWHNARVATAV